ncbi:hypothetical protein [Marivita sp.]|uniref:Tse2 family ADP-ribosyltransferase toxin n=1 Tax=Marivita sp. TaxID=2003365 RepID=UPI003F6C2205
MALTDKDYYRAANKSVFKHGVWEDDDTPAEGVLHGDIEARSWTVTKLIKGGIRVQQVRTRQDWEIKNGYMEPGSGTSLHDHEGEFGYLAWSYFRLPEGTVIPENLVIVQRGAAGHYQIEVRTGGDMTPDALRGALDNLARNCVVRLKQLADGIDR